jgi:hypothetical protein
MQIEHDRVMGVALWPLPYCAAHMHKALPLGVKEAIGGTGAGLSDHRATCVTAESWYGRAAGIDGPTWVMATYKIADCTRYIPYPNTQLRTTPASHRHQHATYADTSPALARNQTTFRTQPVTPQHTTPPATAAGGHNTAAVPAAQPTHPAHTQRTPRADPSLAIVLLQRCQVQLGDLTAAAGHRGRCDRHRCWLSKHSNWTCCNRPPHI